MEPKASSTNILATRIFCTEGTRRFSEVSGDYNPLHLDATKARRLLFGSCVAHGIHLILWALECWAAAEIPNERWRLTFIDADFDRPVRIGSEATCRVKSSENRHIALTIAVDGQVAVRMKFAWRSCLDREVGVDYHLDNPTLEPCRELVLADAAKESGQVPLNLNLSTVSGLLPGLAARFSSRQLARILATTRLVGMVYPGLHSVYSKLRLEFGSKTRADCALHYEVTHLDSRFRSVNLRTTSGEASGLISCFFRLEPQTQSGVTALAGIIEESEFSSQRALIIGGSRGLGEVTARILAEGGARVTLTYANDRADAEKIVEEISVKAGAACCFLWNALEPVNGLEFLSLNRDEAPTHLYYFATPHYAVGRRGHFSPYIFRNFCEFYVSALGTLIEQFPNLQGLFYPSSIALTDLTPGWSEYAAAKAAGEVFCRFLESTRPNLKILCPRLPRLATDQTIGSHFGGPAPDPAEFLLPLLRAWNEINVASPASE
jgi:acyl dehydratase